MKIYLSPSVELLYLADADILTVSDPSVDDPWERVEF